MQFVIYWIISENRESTYIGFSDSIERRIEEYKNKKVRTTINFGDFHYKIVDTAVDKLEARKKERYWKSCAGRKKLKKFFE